MLSALSRTISFIIRHPISGRRPFRSMVRYAQWQAFSRLRRELSVPWIGNVTLVARAGMRGATGNIYCGLHEYPEMAFALHLLRPGDLFLDVGANIGSYSLLASGVVGATSIAIEPAPETAIGLRRNLSANSIEHLVEVREVLVGRSSGDAYMTTGRDTTNQIVPSSQPDVRILPMTTIDEVLADRTPTLIKIDIEGYEEEALAGAERAISHASLRAICTEGYSSEIERILSSRGFQRVFYDPARRQISRISNGIRHTNVLLVRDTKWIQERLSSSQTFTVYGVPL